MSKKDRNDQYAALREAWKKPARRWFMSRLHAFGPGLWTNYNEVSISVGNPSCRRNSEAVPESAWLIWFQLWPPRLMVWKHLTRII